MIFFIVVFFGFFGVYIFCKVFFVIVGIFVFFIFNLEMVVGILIVLFN